MVITCSRVWINRVRFPILFVVSWTGKINIPLSPYLPENLVSRDGFSGPVPRQPAHCLYSDWIWCLLTGFLPSSAAASIIYIKQPYAIRSVPGLSGHGIVYRWRSLLRVRRHRASKPQGGSKRVLPSQVTMDQIIYAFLSHTHNTAVNRARIYIHRNTKYTWYVNKCKQQYISTYCTTDASARTLNFPVQLTTSRFGNLTRLIILFCYK